MEHPDANRIVNFIYKNNMKFKCISNTKLLDIGSVRVIE